MYFNLARLLLFLAPFFAAFGAAAQQFDSTAIGKVKVSGRVVMDGAWFYDTPANTVMGSGATFSEMRVRFSTVLSTRTDLRAEFDFAFGEVSFKDIAARYFVDKNFILSLGNMREPFSPASMASAAETFFIATPTAAQAFGCGRNLGLSARYYTKHFWVEGGVFGQDIYDQIKGSKGFAFTNRIIYRPINEDYRVLQLGAGNSIRRADANGIKTDEGKEVEQRKISFGSRAETNVNRAKLISVNNPYANFQEKFNVEFLGIYQNMALQAEYINTFVSAKEGYDNQRYYGYYAQAIYQIKGKGIQYSVYDAWQTKSLEGSINVGLRYSYTNLNDARGYLVNGIYTNTPDGTTPNGSFNGGAMQGFTASVSFFPIKSMILTMEYNWGKLKNATLAGSNFQFIQAQALFQF